MVPALHPSEPRVVLLGYHPPLAVVRDTRSGEELARLTGHRPVSAAWHPSGAALVVSRDDDALHTREKSLMQGMLNRDDLPQVRAMVARIARELLDSANGRMEAIKLRALLARAPGLTADHVRALFAITGEESSLFDSPELLREARVPPAGGVVACSPHGWAAAAGAAAAPRPAAAAAGAPVGPRWMIPTASFNLPMSTLTI